MARENLTKTKTGLRALFFIIGCLSFLLACTGDDAAKKLSGSTMGTTYHITMINPSSEINLIDLQQDIDIRLKILNGIFSTYEDDSELSRLNRAPVNEWIPVSSEMMQVLEMALAISAQSEGAYDVTVGPLVDLWGFGSKEVAEGVLPDATLVQKARDQVCYQCIEFDVNESRVRKKRELYIDLSSIAKGYAVDEVGNLLYKRQIRDYMVEIGGEVITRGVNAAAETWKLGIESPNLSLPTETQKLQQVIRVSGQGVATSGDYRNFVVIDGKSYSHLINPATGYPVTHNPSSVTVIAETCALADGWATAMTVLGVEKGMVIAESVGLAVYFVSRKPDGSLAATMTKAFEPYLEKS